LKQYVAAVYRCHNPGCIEREPSSRSGSVGHPSTSLIPSVALASFSASSSDGKGPINSFSLIKDNEHQNQTPSFWTMLKLGLAALAIDGCIQDAKISVASGNFRADRRGPSVHRLVVLDVSGGGM
jgi:hypothetical protein